MTIERGISRPKRASFRWLNLAWTMLALACGGNDLGPTTPPGATSEGKSGSATSTVTPAPVFTSVSITPATASVVAGLTTQLTASAPEQNGAPMAGATFTYRSADLTIARVSSTGLVTGVAVGTIHIYVTGTIGSVTKSASVLVTVVKANTILATSGNVFLPATMAVIPGGTVTWTFESLHNVTFTARMPANIPNTSSGSVSRRFCYAGVYYFHCTIHPSMTGTIYVRYPINVGGPPC